jgi:hypothetical protein
MREALPFGVGGGLVAIKTLLSRDPCVHANTAIEMIDAILKEHTAAPTVQEPVATNKIYVTREQLAELYPPPAAQHEPENEPYVSLASVQKPVAWPMEEQPDGSIIPVDPSELPSDYFTTPPAAAVQEGRDWSLLEATQESLREHMAEIKRLKEAQPAVPDAMTSADIQEHIEYVAGWNECRQAMLEMMK